MKLRFSCRKICHNPRDLDIVTKPQMKSFAPGTLDKAEANDQRTVFGVSASLWKGSSGGPCVLLDGFEGGAIIGLGKNVSSFQGGNEDFR